MKYYTIDELSKFKTYAFLGEDSIYKFHYSLVKEYILEDYYPNLTYSAANPDILISVNNESDFTLYPQKDILIVDYINLFMEKGGIKEIEFDDNSIENMVALSKSNDFSQKKLLSNMLFNFDCIKYKKVLNNLINSSYKIRNNFIKTDAVTSNEVAGYLFKYKILYVAYHT